MKLETLDEGNFLDAQIRDYKNKLRLVDIDIEQAKSLPDKKLTVYEYSFGNEEDILNFGTTNVHIEKKYLLRALAKTKKYFESKLKKAEVQFEKL